MVSAIGLVIAVSVACSLLAGVAGMIHASQLYSAEPGSGQNFELIAIAAVVVGGTSFAGGVGTMPGTAVYGWNGYVAVALVMTSVWCGWVVLVGVMSLATLIQYRWGGHDAV